MSASSSSAGMPKNYKSPKELFAVQIDNAHVKRGFWMAGESQETAVRSMCKKYETMTKVDVGKEKTIRSIRFLTKVQNFWFDKVLTELQRVRKENEELRKELNELKKTRTVGFSESK